MDELFGPEPQPAEQGVVQLEGVVDRIVFESPDSGFYVARLNETHRPVATTIVGTGLAVSPGETVRVWGSWRDDQKWGLQLAVSRFEVVQPSTAEGIERFLGSGLIKGVGPKAAQRIVAAFGVETLRVIAETPERLRTVPGIGKKTAQRIAEGYESHRAVQSILVFLQGHGIGPAQAMRVYRSFGDRAVAVIRENPYRLAGEGSGIGFKTADAIAKELGVAADAPVRLSAGIGHVLRESAGHGHTFLTKDEVCARAAAVLEVPEAMIRPRIPVAASEGLVVCEDDRVFSPELDGAERGVAASIARLAKAEREPMDLDPEEAIGWVESHRKLRLSPEQRRAVHEAVAQPVLVITGGPGTGKTTIINSLVALFERKAYGILLAAPTGRAAKRMEQATGREAHTIHRLLGYRPGSGFVHNEMFPLDAEVLIVDETSMVDVMLLHALLRALPPAARVIFVGDVDQLPSVGAGNALMDIIASLRVPAVRLETVFRQAGESGIVANAHRINRGQEPAYNATDFFFVDRPDPQRALETVVELVTTRIPRKFDLDPVRDVQVLAPMHRGAAGVSALNEALQAALNPGGAPLPRKGLRAGDKVMQLRNNYDLDVYNGDVGVIVKIDLEMEEAYIRFDDRTVLYHFDDLDDVSLAYAATIHKSQGSEYPAVVIPMLLQQFVMLQRNVFYTAVTRARRIVVLVGDERAVQRAVRTVDAAARNTALADRLRAMMPAPETGTS